MLFISTSVFMHKFVAINQKLCHFKKTITKKARNTLKKKKKTTTTEIYLFKFKLQEMFKESFSYSIHASTSWIMFTNEK